jgi:hypothetical protein
VTEPPEEFAQRLLAMVQSWTQEWAQRAMPVPPSGIPGPECQWCPLCQLASILRGEHPELAERVAEAGAAVTGAVRALVDAAARHVPHPPEGAAATAPARRPSPAPRVEHIDLHGG